MPDSDFRFRFKIQIPDPDSRFTLRSQIQIHIADCRFRFQLQISSSSAQRSAQFCRKQPSRAMSIQTERGAPQPAETRISSDGHEHLGADAERQEWDGRGGALQPAECQSALQPAESPSVAEVPPVAKAPGQAEAPPVAEAPPPRPFLNPVLATIPESVLVNPVPDEGPKTRQDWTAIAGDGRNLRQPRRDASRAPVWPGLATEAAVAASAATGSSGSISSDRQQWQQWTGSSGSSSSDAPQLAVNADGGSWPLPPTRPPPGAQTTTAHSPPLPCVLTLPQMQAMKPVKGIGGKVGNLKQRALRDSCLQSGIWEVDLTETWPEWRQVLRALPMGQLQLMIGLGVAQFKFRLLQGSRDPNYVRLDSGERHVFEILRVDTSAVQFHYHKNGSLDDLVTLAPTVLPENANSGASQPTVPFVAMAVDPSPSQPVIGRREAVMALDVLMKTCWQTRAGAVDITDAVGFDWNRFFTNTMEALEIQELDIEKVFALRTTESGMPKLAICTTGTEWKIFDPNHIYYKNPRLPALHVMHSNWRTHSLLTQAQMVPSSWTRLR